MGLRQELLELEEPILIVGHLNPDADVISTAFSLIEFYKAQGKDAWFAYKGSIPDNITWAVDESSIADTELLKYNSLVVVDTSLSTVRLGFEPKQVRTMVLDHHDSSKDIEDTSLVSYYYRKTPSTSTILVEAGIRDPLIYLGLFYDSFSTNTNLLESCRIISESLDITEEEIQDMLSLLREKLDQKAIEVIKNSFSVTYNYGNLSLICVTFDSEQKYYFDILAFYAKYSDVLVVYNTSTNIINIKTFDDIFDVADFCSIFGGGGSFRSGAIIVGNKESFSFVFEQLVTKFDTELCDENQSKAVYNI
jgi:hypothetical protein